MKTNLYELKDEYSISETYSIMIQSALTSEDVKSLIDKVSVNADYDLFKSGALNLYSWFPIKDDLYLNKTKYGNFISKSNLAYKSVKLSAYKKLDLK